MTSQAAKTYDSLAESRRQVEKPDVDVDGLIREIEVLSKNVDDDLEADPHQDGGPYKSRRIDSFEDYLTGSGHLPQMELPGFGERGEDCGKPFPHFCENGHTKDIGTTCRQSRCKRCAPTWVRDRSVAKVDQLLGLLKIKLKRKPWLQIFFHHVVISPPPGWQADTDDPLEAGFDVVREIMEEMGLEGVAAYHPYRGSEEGPTGDRGDDRGVWRERLFSGRDWDGDVREELEFSPHWHVITAASWVPGGETTTRIERETGWVVHRIHDEDTGRSVDDDEAMVRAVTYCISHAGIYEDSNGDMRGAVRELGSTINHEVRVGANEEWAERKTKKIAWQTLGIPSADLSCDETVHEPAKLDVDKSVGSSTSSESGDVHDLDSCGCGDDHDHDDEDVEEVGASGADAHTSNESRCGGDLTNLFGAPHRLIDEDWCERADAADQLLATYLEYRDEEPSLKDVEERVGLTLHEDHIEELRDDGGGG